MSLKQFQWVNYNSKQQMWGLKAIVFAPTGYLSKYPVKWNLQRYGTKKSEMKNSTLKIMPTKPVFAFIGDNIGADHHRSYFSLLLSHFSICYTTMKFNKTKFKVLHLGQGNSKNKHRLAGEQIENSLRRKTWGCWLMRTWSSNVHSQPRKPTASWAASKAACPAEQNCC